MKLSGYFILVVLVVAAVLLVVFRDALRVPGSAALNPTQVENALAGSADWGLTQPATDHEVEGYASLTSVNRGSSIDLHVNLKTPGDFTYEVFRMGWYAGKGARRVLGPSTVAGIRQPDCPMDPEYGTFDCDWSTTFALDGATTAPWASGVYLIRLTTSPAAGGHQSYIVLTLRDDSRQSDFVFQSSVTTWQAYNDWPGARPQAGGSAVHGKSIYGLLGECTTAAQCDALSHPASFTERGALKVSFNRPYGVTRGGSAVALGDAHNPNAIPGLGAGEFLTNLSSDRYTTAGGWEYNMVRFLEREGYDVSYITNLDTHEQGGAWLNQRYRAFLSVGHDEYWSRAMRQAVEQARDQGLHLGFFSSNTMFWQMRLEPVRGQPNRLLVAFKNGGEPPSQADIPERQNYVTGAQDVHLPATDRTRRWTEVGESEALVIGSGGAFSTTHDPSTFYSDDVELTGVADETGVGWVFAATSAAVGSVVPGLLGMEVAPLGRANTTLIAHSHASGGGYGDFTHYTNGGATSATVVSTGTIQWSWGLDDFDASCSRPSFVNRTAGQMTRNLLARLSGQQGGLSADGARVSGFEDSFFRLARDADVWALQALSEGPRSGFVKVAQGAGRLSITTADNKSGKHYSGYTSRRAIDFAGKQVVVRIDQPLTSPSAQMLLAVTANADNWFRIVQEATGLLFEMSNAGHLMIGPAITFNPTSHRWWRLRHVVVGKAPATANEILFETNDQPGLHAWVTRHRVLAPSWFHSVYVELQAGSDAATPSETAIFGSVSVDGAQPEVLDDNFADYYQDRARWVTATLSVSPFPGAGCATQGGGALELRLPARQRRAYEGANWNYTVPSAWLDAPNYFGYVSRDWWDFEGKTLQVEAVQSPSSDASTIFGIGVDHVNWIRFVRLGPELLFQASNAGSQSTAYSDTTHRWWRITHDPSGIHLQTSPDTLTWVTRRTFPAPSWLHNVRVELQLGTPASVAVPVPARFRSLTMH